MHLACVLATALTVLSVGPLQPQQDTSSNPPPAAQAPTPAPTENTQTPPVDLSQPAAQTEAPKIDPAKKRPAKGNARKRRAKPATAAGEPRKIVVHQGGVSEPTAQIVPGITQEEASRQRQNAEQLLTSTEANLKHLAARTLTSNQQGTVAQIHHYLDGAHTALKDSDTQRAHTLAQKAYLLSDDLVKH